MSETMMRRLPRPLLIALSLTLALFLLLAAILLASGTGFVGASSHREAPLISQDPTVDNLDTYAFVSPDDPTKVTLISNWIPFEEPGGGPNFYHFDENARYLIKIDRDGDAVEDITFEWVFDMRVMNPGTFLYNTGPITDLGDPDFNLRQYYTVTMIMGVGTPVSRTVLGGNLLMVPDNIGPRSTPNYAALAALGVRDLGNGIKEFTGQRDDPFFVDVGSIFDLAGLRPLNGAHLIQLPTASGQDVLRGFNMHTTAIQVPKTLLAPECDNQATNKACVIGIWSTAERRELTVRAAGSVTASGPWVQVSRLGNPLVNEVVIDLARKDIFNAIPPTADAAALDRVLTPELASLIPVLYPGVTVPPTPRTDLVTVFLTGIPDLNQQQNSTVTPSEQLRLNLAIAPTAGVCQGNIMGVIAGDNAGFPNGRRLEDDVTDIALRVVAGGYVLTPDFNISPNNILTDGVQANDVPCLPHFPYMGTPHPGYENHHGLPILQNFFALITKR